jgi:hypothetical protein
LKSRSWSIIAGFCKGSIGPQLKKTSKKNALKVKDPADGAFDLCHDGSVKTALSGQAVDPSLEFAPFRVDAVAMDLITVYTAFNPAQAHLIASRLEASDFLVNVKNENAALGMDGYTMAVGGILVQVPEDQVEDARALIKSCEESEGSQDAS